MGLIFCFPFWDRAFARKNRQTATYPRCELPITAAAALAAALAAAFAAALAAAALAASVTHARIECCQEWQCHASVTGWSRGHHSVPRHWKHTRCWVLLARAGARVARTLAARGGGGGSSPRTGR